MARADMRDLPFGSTFDLVVNLFTSFGYFDEDRENEKALAEMVRVLVPGGLFVMDHMNRTKVKKNLVPKDEVKRGDLLVRQERRIKKNRVMKDIRVDLKDGERIHLKESVRLFSPEEIRALFKAHGLYKVRFFGSLEGEPLRAESQRMIAAATKC